MPQYCSLLEFYFLYGGLCFRPLFCFFRLKYIRTNSAQSEEEEKELVQRENFLTVQKAVTYYLLKKDDIGDSLRETDLLRETAQTYDHYSQ